MKKWHRGAVAIVACLVVLLVAFFDLLSFPPSICTMSNSVEEFEEALGQILAYDVPVTLSEDEYVLDGDVAIVSEEIVEKYDLAATQNEDGKYVVEFSLSTDGEIEVETNSSRLIVYDDEYVDDFGAVVCARYGCLCLLSLKSFHER